MESKSFFVFRGSTKVQRMLSILLRRASKNVDEEFLLLSCKLFRVLVRMEFLLDK